MMQYPDIGLGNAAQYLHDALVPAYARFRQKQTRETLLAVASPAWALHERLWHDQGCKPPKLEKFRARLFKECPDLELLRDYVETGKHTGLSRKNPPVRLVGLTGAENPGGVVEMTSPFGTLIAPLECTLTFNYPDGKSYKVTDVIKRVVDFWVKKLS
jgi:hypothetical protein